MVGDFNGTSKYILAGVTSYGYGCAEKGYPGYIFWKLFIYLSFFSSNYYSKNELKQIGYIPVLAIFWIGSNQI